jgi:hypothetical protein
MPLATRVPKPDPPQWFASPQSPAACLRDASPDCGMCHGEGAHRVSLPRASSVKQDRGSAQGQGRVYTLEAGLTSGLVAVECHLDCDGHSDCDDIRPDSWQASRDHSQTHTHLGRHTIRQCIAGR